MREHAEWFLGTSSKVDKDLRPSWEARATVILPNEMDNVVRTAAVLAGASQAPAKLALPGPLKRYAAPFRQRVIPMYNRRTHPWYPDSRYAPLQVTKSKERVTFKTGPTNLRIVDHPTLKGRRKGHWLAGLVLKQPFTGDHLYLVEFRATGRNGILTAHVASGSSNTGRTETSVYETFGKDGRSLRRKAALAALVLDRKTLNYLDPQPTGATGMFNIYIVWQPLDDDAPLEGEWRVTRLDFASQ